MNNPQQMAMMLRGGQVSSTPLGSTPMPQAPAPMEQPNVLASLLKGGAAYNNATHGGLNRMLGFTNPNPNSAGGMAGALAGRTPAAGGAGLGPAAAALPVQQNAGAIGGAVGGMLDKLPGKGFGLGDQARAAGSFVQGDFGGAWGGLKDSVKNLFKVF